MTYTFDVVIFESSRGIGPTDLCIKEFDTLELAEEYVHVFNVRHMPKHGAPEHYIMAKLR